MKLSAIFLTVLSLSGSAHNFADAKRITKGSNDQVTEATNLTAVDLESAVPASSIFSREVHVTVANLHGSTFTRSEAAYFRSALISAYEISRAPDEDDVHPHMVGANILKRTKVPEASGVRALVYKRGRSKVFYYDYSLWLDFRCNCGDVSGFWDKRALSRGSDFDQAQLELAFCTILRASPYKMFKDVKDCSISFGPAK